MVAADYTDGFLNQNARDDQGTGRQPPCWSRRYWHERPTIVTQPCDGRIFDRAV